MRRNGTLLGLIVILTILALAAPAFAEEIEWEKGDIVTKRGTVKQGISKKMLYEVFQDQDRIFAHRAIGQEWIVFRDWTTEPKTDVVTILLTDGVVTGWKHAFVPTPTNEGSIYEYKPTDKIERWFFPEGQSRWDGANMAVQDWYMLTDVQKVMFLTECVKEMEKQSGSDMSIDTFKYILAVNHYADTCSTTYATQKLTDVIKTLHDNEIKLIEEAKAREAAAKAAAAEAARKGSDPNSASLS